MAAERTASDKVGTQHKLIESLLRGMREALAGDDAARAAARVKSLHRALMAHFRLEEDHYFPVLESERPQLRPELEVLRGEHAEMRAVLEEIAGALADGAQERAADAGRALECAFHTHEAREEPLITA